ncbi:50S ribosomal protein L11 methyltransferase [Shimia sp.]|uniref:50S ribosomal protein L11 methyltransferase n=1 Tax=Shimia sp. TaxID=1954381 RepID=UPI003BA841AE
MLEKHTPASTSEFTDTASPLHIAAEADALVEQAQIQPLSDGGLMTSRLLSEALSKVPHHHDAQLLNEQLNQMFVPRWHFPMLADTDRNSAYAKAIAAKVQHGDIVLDIGSGAGLTAMLAARAGAKHVYAVEHQPLIAAAAKRVIAANGLSDRVTVINKWSHNIVVGEDIPEKADVVLSEIVDSNLLGEGALATLKHAMTTLAKPNARAIPERGTLMAQLVESDALVAQWRPQLAEGFDLSAFHHFAKVAQVTPNDATACPLRALGPAKALFHFDFADPNIFPEHTSAELPCLQDGTIHAVLVSFEMELAPGISVSNGLQSKGHWGRTAYLLDQATPANIDTSVLIVAQHDATKLSLCVESIKAPAIIEAPTGANVMWNSSRATMPQANKQAQL